MIAKLAIAVLCLFAVGAILILLIHRIGRSGSARVNSDWIKYGVFLGVVIAFLASAFIGRPVFCLLLGVLVAAVGAELWSNFKGHSGHGTFAAGCITAIIAVGLAHLLFFRSEEWFASCAFVLLLVFVTDSYAQLIGRLAGRHRLCPRISPNKTVEGFLGGVVMAVVSALIFSFILPRITLNQIVGSDFLRRQTKNRSQGFFGIHSRPRRRPRPNRQSDFRLARFFLGEDRP